MLFSQSHVLYRVETLRNWQTCKQFMSICYQR
uniref:Uncharacterized protein MANES_15G111100 n=1 Tax=Rhizophora mucronata TaxID=61149 RepID=A0A2P2M204_RHIMU